MPHAGLENYAALVETAHMYEINISSLSFDIIFNSQVLETHPVRQFIAAVMYRPLF